MIGHLKKLYVEHVPAGLKAINQAGLVGAGIGYTTGATAQIFHSLNVPNHSAVPKPPNWPNNGGYASKVHAGRYHNNHGHHR